MSGWLEALLGKVLSSGVSIPLSKGLNFTGDLVASRNPSTSFIDIAFRPLFAKYFPFAPSYDVRDFGAKCDGVTDDTTALNAAHAAANLVPGRVFYGAAHRITAATTPITNNNIVLVGRGRFNGGTHIIVDSATPIDAFTISGCQYSGLQSMWISGARVYSSGHAVRIVNCYHGFADDLLISQMFEGVEVFRSTHTDITRVDQDDMYGPRGFYAHGDGVGPVYNHAVRFDHCFAGTSYPNAVVGSGKTWATSTAYVVGNIAFANGSIWQCVQNGTSSGAGSGPSGFPSTNPATVHTTQVTDGGAKWVFAMPLCAWFLQGSYSQTFEMRDCGALQGGYGLSVEDDAPGVNSAPQFTRVDNLQTDHTFARGVRLLAGAEAEFTRLFVTSVLEGSGVEIGSRYSGNWRFSTGLVFGCNRAGVIINASDGMIQNFQIGGVSTSSSNTRDCIEIGSSAQHVKVRGCTGGRVFGATSPLSRYGVSVAAGCDHYVVEGNDFTGNVTAPILNTPGQATTRIIRNNTPESAYYDAPDGVYKVSLSAGVQTLTVPAGTHTAIITPTGAVVIDQIVHQSVPALTNSGVRMRIIKEQSAATGTVALRDNSTSINSVWTPNSVDWMLSRFNDAVEVVQCLTTQSTSVRWHIVGRSTPMATVSIVVPAVAAGAVGYVDTSLSATNLGGITTADVVAVNPTSDLVAAGAGGGFLNARISATDTLRAAFVGPLAGGAVNFRVTKVSYVG